jgi:hypothetical protein
LKRERSHLVSASGAAGHLRPGASDGVFPQPDELDRRRRLVAFSRHHDTPRHLLIELLADGNDYVVLQSGVETKIGDSWQAVLAVLASANSKVTRLEILTKWPCDFDTPDRTTLWRWLSRAVAHGIIRQEGKGRPQDPFRYWLPTREEMPRPERATLEELQAWHNRPLAELFDRLELPSAPQQAPPALGADAGA